MSAARTPGPWRICDDADVVDARGRYVATAHDATSDVGTAVEYANAEFIVRACNSHDALLAALEACQAELYRVTSERNASSPHSDMIVCDARAAIAQARGEQVTRA
jgi:hypothetical protein